MAQRFDVSRLRLTGNPVTIAGHVSAPEMTNGAVLSASASGVLTFSGANDVNGEHLVWFSRTGQRLTTIDTPAILHNPTLSPDQKKVLGQSLEVGRSGIWLIDLQGGAPIRVADDGNVPLWSPDGARIAFTAGRITGVDDIFIQSTAGHRDDELVLRTAQTKHVHGWSPDGRFIVYVDANPETNMDLWLLPMFGERNPIPFLRTHSNEMQGQISPDGHWIAYASDESGAWTVYVQSFPPRAGGPIISIGAGTEPLWRRDGKELFYLAPNQTLLAVKVKPGDTWQAERAMPLFQMRIPPGAAPRNHYAVSGDGQRFVVDSMDELNDDELTTVLVNWVAVLKR